MAELTYIAIDKLHPHPDNPRKDLGDLSELAASIKENGVYQNLTVVPGHALTDKEYSRLCKAYQKKPTEELRMEINNRHSDADYTIIIGHRRAAAAQQAGLIELPCVVVEMTEPEQLQTMMIENMQRSDLTVYEQAQGFQLMLDMGDTVQGLSEKSGFSESTIRRRVKLLELDQGEFKKAEKRGATLSDFAELDKIENLNAKNEVLETLGTVNFRRALQDALNAQKYEHRKVEWIEQLRKFAMENPNANYQTHEYVSNFGPWNMNKDAEAPEDAGTVKYFYKICDREIDLYRERNMAAKSAEDKEREAKRQREQLYKERLASITECMFDLRRDFVKQISKTDCKKRLADIVLYAIKAMDECACDEELALSLLGVDYSLDEARGMELTDYLAEIPLLKSAPEKALLLLAYAAADDAQEGYWGWNWNNEKNKGEYGHDENDKLDATYKILTALGYEMADDEKALQDGTHQLFVVYGSGSKADTPCDKCKAAHPECDKCRKTCDDHCNAFQLCRKEFDE